LELADRNVVITGAGSGIGRALAERVAAERPRALVVADLDLPAVQSLEKEIGAVAVQADVSREEEIKALISRATEVGGQVDVFVSNAGVPGPAGGPEAPDDDWELAWKVNVMAHVWAARALLPEMTARGEGYLVSTASAAGLLTQASALAYSATKHAAVAVAEWLSIIYAEAGVRVSCLCPLAVSTPMLERALEDPVGSTVLLADEVLEPSDVAEAVIQGIREERFLILPHPRVAEYMALRGARHDRWLQGMRRLVSSGRGSG
jgi:NAD(P)-dependent dehydrogenase (short-subunit alcohol dehydrogenase family)